MVNKYVLLLLLTTTTIKGYNHNNKHVNLIIMIKLTYV